MESYACTFTLRPNMYRHSLKKQYDLLKSAVESVPFYLSLVCELTNSGNIHAHGIIKEVAKTVQGSFKQYILEYFRGNKVIGYICLKPITDKDKWVKYCLKNYYQTKVDLYFAPTVMINEDSGFPKGIEITSILLEMLYEHKNDPIIIDDI